MEHGVQTGASPLRVRESILRSVHEALRSRLGILMPICGTVPHHPVEMPQGIPVTCRFCNGTEPRVNWKEE